MIRLHRLKKLQSFERINIKFHILFQRTNAIKTPSKLLKKNITILTNYAIQPPSKKYKRKKAQIARLDTKSKLRNKFNKYVRGGNFLSVGHFGTSFTATLYLLCTVNVVQCVPEFRY